MIESFKRPPGSLRWPPRQRFLLTQLGREACEERGEAIAASRAANEGRDGLEQREREWADRRSIEPGDGIFLAELLEGPQTASQLAERLADFGSTRAEAQAALDRLFKAGLVAAETRGQPDPQPG